MQRTVVTWSRLRTPFVAVLALFVLTACSGPIGRVLVEDKSYQSGQSNVDSGTYRIQRGDTVYGIAQRFGLSTRALIDWNGLQPPYTLIAGETLQLPLSQGYIVQRGDSLSVISERFGVDMASLAQVNNLSAPYTIYPGQHLQLPGGSVSPAQVASATPAARPRRDDAPSPQSSPAEPVRTTSLPPVKTSPAPASNAPAPSSARVSPPPRSGGGFIWPVEGRVISGYGAKEDGLHNDGVNIAAPRGAPVRAADDGVVAYAGKEIRGFGNLLLIKHEGGLITAYAHNDAMLVSRGDKVTRGQVIAKVGTSGGVSSPQLHFEVRQGTRAVDPGGYLPG